MTRSSPLKGSGKEMGSVPDLRLARIDQDEGDAARLLASVHPGMVGRLLHHHVARLEMHHAVVEQHVDLAGHDHRVVEAARAVHHRVARRPAFGGSTGARDFPHWDWVWWRGGRPLAGAAAPTIFIM